MKTNIHRGFSRQFLISPKHQNIDWPQYTFGQDSIYAHPDLSVHLATKAKFNFATIGYIIDPHHPERSDLEILKDMSEAETPEEIAVKLYTLGGRFVLLVQTPQDTFVFHDPCGLRSVYYTSYRNELFIASQPGLLSQVIPLKKAERYRTYQESSYCQNDREHWLPSGISLFEDLHHLVPNHYLQCSTLKQHRYYPNKSLKKVKLKEAVERSAIILKGLIEAAQQRYELSLPITAGLDSRVLMAASKDHADDVFFYTLQYRDLQENSEDIFIPRQILNKLNLSHHLINCKIPPTDHFKKLYDQSVFNAHDDWCTIAYGLYLHYPKQKVVIKGNVAEIARCFYYSTELVNHEVTAKTLIGYEKNWSDLNFIEQPIVNWFQEISRSIYNYIINDFFYWEHRMGSWQAQSQLEWDIAQETFSPFNHRELMDILLAVDPKYRSAPDFILFKKIIKKLWPELLKLPINPSQKPKKPNLNYYIGKHLPFIISLKNKYFFK